MTKKTETTGVLTSGGDAPGMNAIIRAAVRIALHHGVKVKGVMRGYPGLFDEEFIDINARSVADVISRGGITLYTVRYMKMVAREGQRQAAEICRKHGVDGVAVTDGDGSSKGVGKLSKLSINAIGMSGTIDLNTACTEHMIGFNTAANTIVDTIDKVRDTSIPHECYSAIEVMGHHAGYITFWSGIAAGSDAILILEHYDGSEQEIVNHIIASRKRGRKHFIIISAEGIEYSSSMAERIEAATNTETRATILGYIQCGGLSSCKDRLYASIMGSKAVDLLAEGKSNRLVAYQNDEFHDFDIKEVLHMKEDIPAYQLELSAKLTR